MINSQHKTGRPLSRSGLILTLLIMASTGAFADSVSDGSGPEAADSAANTNTNTNIREAQPGEPTSTITREIESESSRPNTSLNTNSDSDNQGEKNTEEHAALNLDPTIKPKTEPGVEVNSEVTPGATSELDHQTPDDQTLNNHSTADFSLKPDDDIDISPDMQRALLRYRAAIKELDENGPYHEQSSEALYGLGIELKRQGFYSEALNTLERAMHINRVNYGLESLSQIPMLKSIIDTQKLLNRFEDVTTDYGRLLRLSMKNYSDGDPALIRIFKELALWHVDVHQIDGSISQVDHLTSAQSLITIAIKNAQLANTQSTQEKTDLLRTFALINYYSSQHESNEWATASNSHYSASADRDFLIPARMVTLPNSSYRQGRIAYEQIIALVEADPDATIRQKIGAYVETGDWHLIYSHSNRAMEYYRQALELIEQQPKEREILTQFWFSNPAFLPALRAERTPGKPARHTISVQLDISEDGHPDNINIIEPALENNQNLRTAAYKTIRNTRFRPRFVDGLAVASPATLIKMPLIH